MRHSGVKQPSNFTNTGEAERLAPALLSLYPQRVMLNSRELAAVVRLESGAVPTSQLLAWAKELHQSKPQQVLNTLLHQLAQRTLRWQSSHVGDKYGSAQIDPNQLEVAFNELITEVRQAEAEAHDLEVREVITWIIQRLLDLKHRVTLPNTAAGYLSIEMLLPTLQRLSIEAQERIFISAPESIKKQVHTRVQSVLVRESNRARPQDFVIAQKAVWWSMMRSELNLPPLRLCLFDGW
jgi:hypothetical protein